MPISSICPSTSTVGASGFDARSHANELPVRSRSTSSANVSASVRQTAATSRSYPEGPGVSIRVFRNVHDSDLTGLTLLRVDGERRNRHCWAGVKIRQRLGRQLNLDRIVGGRVVGVDDQRDDDGHKRQDEDCGHDGVCHLSSSTVGLRAINSTRNASSVPGASSVISPSLQSMTWTRLNPADSSFECRSSIANAVSTCSSSNRSQAPSSLRSKPVKISGETPCRSSNQLR